MAKSPAVHMANAEGAPLCNVKAQSPVVNKDMTEVTCVRCEKRLKKDAE